MNAAWTYRQPYLALVDDDPQSARLLTRMLLAHGAPSVRWLESADHGRMELAELLAASEDQLPELVIVDLKVPSEATAAFIRSVRSMPYAHSLVIAAMTSAPERRSHEMQLSAGADAVFERVADGTDYRREAARLVSYWVRSQRLDAVGA